MAPHQYEGCDNNSNNDNQLLRNANNRGNIIDAELKMTAPKGILRKRIPKASTSVMPSHWPLPFQDDNTVVQEERNLSVHFASYIIASTNFRPRTHILDISKLYYSCEDIAQFKREYRRVVRQKHKKEARENSKQAEMSSDVNDGGGTRQLPSHHDNTFWRSKVNRRWTVPPPTGSMQSPTGSMTVTVSDEVPLQQSVDSDGHTANSSIDGNNTNHDDDLFWDPLNDGTSLVSSSSAEEDEGDDNSSYYNNSGGIFSSVFDVARGAVSILNGSGPYYSTTTTATSSSTSSGDVTTKRSRRPSFNSRTASLHLVDTLYLF